MCVIIFLASRRRLHHIFCSLGCGHIYCADCFLKWRAKISHDQKLTPCPECREETLIRASKIFAVRDLFLLVED